MRISDWSSDVCSSDLQRISQAIRKYLRVSGRDEGAVTVDGGMPQVVEIPNEIRAGLWPLDRAGGDRRQIRIRVQRAVETQDNGECGDVLPECRVGRSEEHTSELQSLMRISYAVLCLQKTN